MEIDSKQLVSERKKLSIILNDVSPPSKMSCSTVGTLLSNRLIPLKCNTERQRACPPCGHQLHGSSSTKFIAMLYMHMRVTNSAKHTSYIFCLLIHVVSVSPCTGSKGAKADPSVLWTGLGYAVDMSVWLFSI